MVYKGTKNKKTREVPGTEDTWAALEQLRTESEYIIPGKDQTDRLKNGIIKASEWMRGLGWDQEQYSKTLHELRKLVGSVWCSKAGPARAAQWLGDTIQVTMHFYVAVIGESAAVEV
jgi:hypothetical protein